MHLRKIVLEMPTAQPQFDAMHLPSGRVLRGLAGREEQLDGSRYSKVGHGLGDGMLGDMEGDK